MSGSLDSLLSRCTVRLTAPTGQVGTGVFVAPGMILTCAHVVRGKAGERQLVRVEWDQRSEQASTTHLVPEPCRGEEIYPDLALIEVTWRDNPCVWFDRHLEVGDLLYTFGYPQGRSSGDSLTITVEGPTRYGDGGDRDLLKLKTGQVEPGFSGSPLLNLSTGGVCGILKRTRDEQTDLGGRAIRLDVILRHFQFLRELPDQLGNGLRWYQALEERQDHFASATPYRQPKLRTEELDSLNLFYYGSRRVEFRGRNAELEQLDEFLKSSAHFAWYLLVGPAGSGKSRLALELCLRHRNRWRAGFVDKSTIADTAFWQAWRPLFPTLLVVDYASAYAAELGNMARCLKTKNCPDPVPVRLLLLERDVKEEWYDRFLGKGNSERERALAAQYPARAAEPVRLGSLSDDDLAAVIQSINPVAFSVEKKEVVLNRLRHISPENAVLFAVLLAATSHVSADRVEVMREILRRERLTRWQPTGVDSDDESLLAFATICGGLPIPKPGSGSGWLEGIMKRFSPLRYRAMVGRQATSNLAPLEPDVLGELYVLDWAQTLAEYRVSDVLSTAWSLSPQGCFLFMRRAVPDFPDHEALPRLFAPPDGTSRARSMWASCVVDLLNGIPAQYIELGSTLYEKLRGLAETHLGEPELFENYCRATLNVVRAHSTAHHFDRASELQAHLETLLTSHLDQQWARNLQMRMLAGNLVLNYEMVHAELARPLGPAPLTFVGAERIASVARAGFAKLSHVCKQRKMDGEACKWYAVGAFHFLLVRLEPVLVSWRIWVPAVLLLEDGIKTMLKEADRIYRGLRSFVSRDCPLDGEVRSYLAKAASVLCAAYAQRQNTKKAVPLCRTIAKLAHDHTAEPELRMELARAQYNLVFAFHKAGEVEKAIAYFKDLCALVDRFPGEAILSEKRDKAGKLLHEA